MLYLNIGDTNKSRISFTVRDPAFFFILQSPLLQPRQIDTFGYLN